MLRLVDIAANMMQLGIQIAGDHRQRIRALAASVDSIQADFLSGRVSDTVLLLSSQRLANVSPGTEAADTVQTNGPGWALCSGR
jgi:hypothetical protein